MFAESPKENITPVQLFCLSFAYIFGGMFLHGGAYVSGRETWISALIAAGCGVLIILMYYLAAKFYYKNSNAAENGFTGWLRFTFGKAIGSVFAFLYLLFFSFYAAYGIFVFAKYLNATSAPGISSYIFAYIFFALCILVVYRGLTAAGRMAESAIVFIGAALLIILGGFLSVSHFSEYLPLFESPIENIVFGTLNSFLSPFCDSAVFLCIIGKVVSTNTPQASVYAKMDSEIYDGIPGTDITSGSGSDKTGNHTKKRRIHMHYGTLLLAAAVSAVIFLIINLRDQALFGSGLLSKLSYPTVLAAELVPELNLRPVFDLCFTILYVIRISVMLFAVYFILTELFPSAKKSKFPSLFLMSLQSFLSVISFYAYFDPAHLISEKAEDAGFIFVRGSIWDNIFIIIAVSVFVMIPFILFLRAAFSAASAKKGNYK